MLSVYVDIIIAYVHTWMGTNKMVECFTEVAHSCRHLIVYFEFVSEGKATEMQLRLVLRFKCPANVITQFMLYHKLSQRSNSATEVMRRINLGELKIRGRGVMHT